MVLDDNFVFVDEYEDLVDLIDTKELLVRVTDGLYFTRINLYELASYKLGEEKIRKRTTATIVQKLYDAKVIDEWSHASFMSVRQFLSNVRKGIGYKDDEDLRNKLISALTVLDEFEEYIRELKLSDY